MRLCSHKVQGSVSPRGYGDRSPFQSARLVTVPPSVALIPQTCRAVQRCVIFVKGNAKMERLPTTLEKKKTYLWENVGMWAERVVSSSLPSCQLQVLVLTEFSLPGVSYPCTPLQADFFAGSQDKGGSVPHVTFSLSIWCL